MGTLCVRVLQTNQLAPGTFCADTEHRTLYAWDSANQDLNRALTEASARAEILRVQGAHVQVRGVRFRYAANAAQHGAVILAGEHDVLEDCVVEDTNASGAGLAASDLIVRRCTFRHNGQLGFGASHAHRLLFTECLVEDNNAKNFARGWEAGGNKLVLSRDVVLEKSRFLRNRGNGIWFDIGNEQCTVRQCLIANNEDAGIFYEISYGLHAEDNVIVGNGFAETTGAWGAQAGICLSSSPNSVIERNLMIGNREGFDFREQARTTPTIGDRTGRAIWNHDEVVRNNIIAYNRDAQVWGWLDIPEARAWPRPVGIQASSAAPEEVASTHPSSEVPSGLNLEQLNLFFENNVYFATERQGGFNWGPPWRRHRNFKTLAEFQEALHVDGGSIVVEPPFADLLSHDFRLSQDAMARFGACYPRGAVPGVLLSDREKAAY